MMMMRSGRRRRGGSRPSLLAIRRAVFLVCLWAAMALGAAPALAQPDYRGFVALSEMRPDWSSWAGGTDSEGHQYTRFWAADTSRDSTAGVLAGDQHWAVRFGVSTPTCVRTEGRGDIAGPAQVQIDRVSGALRFTVQADSAALTKPRSGHNYPAACDGAPVPFSNSGDGSQVYGLGTPVDVPLGDAAPLPETVSETVTFSRPGTTFEYQATVCMSRSAADGDGDGIPDPVDPAPAEAATSAELGVPGGRALWSTPKPPVYPAGAGYATGLPGCGPTDARGPRGKVRLALEVDGPGRIGLIGRASCRDECSVDVDPGEQVTIHALPDESNGGLKGFRGCPGEVAYGRLGECTFRATRDVKVVAVFDPLPSYSPSVHFTSGEKHWPMDPGRFVNASSLAFANPNGPHGKGCPTKDARIVPRGKLIVSWLRKGKYSYRYCSGRSAQRPKRVRLNTAQLTAPSEGTGKPKVTYSGGGRWGFYLNLDDRLWSGVRPSGGSYASAPDIYYQYEPRKWLVYWLFFARNFHKVGPINDLHEGDWERVAVRLNGRNQATHVAYWQHYCKPRVIRWSQMERDGAIYGLSHPSAYVTRGAHATYPKPGRTRLPCKNPLKGGMDDHRGGGPHWETWQFGVHGFKDVTKASWYGFGGSWGSRTAKGDERFWGPLGPGPKKRPQPPGW